MFTARSVQVRRAKEHVAQGEENLRQAKRLGQNTRKWLCIVLIVLLVIAIIIVVVAVQPWQYANDGGGNRRLLMVPQGPGARINLRRRHDGSA